MFHAITDGARWLDLWLHERLGRPYQIIISVGLVTDITQRLANLPKRLSSAGQLGATILTLLFEAALLIHQLAELSERRHARKKKQANSNPSPSMGEG